MNPSHHSVSRLALCAAIFCGGVVLMVLVTGTGIRLRSPSWLLDCAVALALLFTVFCMKALRDRHHPGNDLTTPPPRSAIRPIWIGHLLLVLVALLAADAVRRCVERIVGRQGGEAQSHFERGNALVDAGNYAEACKQYAKAVEINPRHAEACGNWGNALFALGRHADACEKYAQVVQINPRDALAYHNWGLALGKLGRYAEACLKHAKAVEIKPRLAEAYDNWGIVLGKMGKYPEALGKFAKAVEINPRFSEAYANWGLALTLMGKRAEAEEKWNKAAELDPALKPQIKEMRKQLLGKE